MPRTNRNWLPTYCHPESLLPKVQETRSLFRWPPYPFREFVGKAMRFLQTDEVRRLGFELDPARALPCKWRCADESLYGVDLALYAQTGHYPFDKGAIGGSFNAGALRAAVHHGPINIDFGGSHVGYVPGPGGGSFGRIWRPQCGDHSTDCGKLAAMIAPFVRVYEDAIANILVFRPAGEAVLLSVPNEFVQPIWSQRTIKLLIDSDTLTAGEVDFDAQKPYTRTTIGRSLFRASERFLAELDGPAVERFSAPEPTPIGRHLSHPYFNIFDEEVCVRGGSLPEERLLLYIKYVLAAQHTPPPLKVAIINTNIEHNHLVDTVRDAAYQPYAFASFSGIFIDMFDEKTGSYANLFQPLSIAIKPAGTTQEVELGPEEIHHRFDRLERAEPVLSIRQIMRSEGIEHLLTQFTYRPEDYRRTVM